MKEHKLQAKEPLSIVRNISLEITGIVGKTKLPLKKVLQLDRGSVVEFDREEGEDIEVLINGKKVATAQIVAVGERYGLRVTGILN